MQVKRFLCTLAFGLGAATLAPAADKSGVFAQEGPGRLSCEDAFALDPNGQNTRIVAAWLTGFLTAHNALLPDTFDLTPWQGPDTLMALLNQYCSAHPKRSVTDGTLHLVQYLKQGQLDEAAKMVVLGTEGARIALYDVVVADARHRLNNAGFPSGPTLDNLSDAVAAYQKSLGLQVTGVLDQATLRHLLE